MLLANEYQKGKEIKMTIFIIFILYSISVGAIYRFLEAMNGPDDMTMMYSIFWPLILLLILAIAVFGFLVQCGIWIAELFVGKK